MPGSVGSSEHITVMVRIWVCQMVAFAPVDESGLMIYAAVGLPLRQASEIDCSCPRSCIVIGNSIAFIIHIPAGVRSSSIAPEPVSFGWKTYG